MKHLRLAVAGGRKTQSIIDECVSASAERRILALTYTQANQDEIRRRLNARAPLDAHVTVQGWFSFLLTHWVRPYVPRLYAECRLRGLNFDGDPGQYAKGKERFLDKERRAYKRHLAHLALDVNEASSGAVVDRLSRLYDAVYVDEVQDLNGYDLEILDVLIDSPISITLVGDVRQAVLQTNVRDPKNSQYKGVKIKKWFDERCSSGRLSLKHESRTWRCNQSIAHFADSIFDETWGFPKTVSCNEVLTDHDGLFAVAAVDASAYLDVCGPLCLRYSAAIAKGVELPFINIGIAKGMDVERVLIWPTAAVLEFLRRGTRLEPTPCCSLYVAVTRARASVAFVVEQPERLSLPVWTAG